jgi:hypothetical protein
MSEVSIDRRSLSSRAAGGSGLAAAGGRVVPAAGRHPAAADQLAGDRTASGLHRRPVEGGSDRGDDPPASGQRARSAGLGGERAPLDPGKPLVPAVRTGPSSSARSSRRHCCGESRSTDSGPFERSASRPPSRQSQRHFSTCRTPPATRRRCRWSSRPARTERPRPTASAPGPAAVSASTRHPARTSRISDTPATRKHHRPGHHQLKISKTPALGIGEPVVATEQPAATTARTAVLRAMAVRCGIAPSVSRREGCLQRRRPCLPRRSSCASRLVEAGSDGRGCREPSGEPERGAREPDR